MRARLVVWVALAGCGSPAKHSSTGAPPRTGSCLADGLGTLSNRPRADDACAAANECTAQCAKGDGESCLLQAYALQKEAADDPEATKLYGRACALGVANACTNYGANLWLGHQPAPPDDEACAGRLFERACAVREQFACGMLGRMKASNAKTPAEKEAARRWFDQECNDLGSMTCRMYALHLENGELGPFEPATVRALMQRACDTGDEDACGHETAAETFH